MSYIIKTRIKLNREQRRTAKTLSEGVKVMKDSLRDYPGKRVTISLNSNKK